MAVKAANITAGQAIQALQVLQGLLSSPFPALLAFSIGKTAAKLQLNADVMAAESARRATAVKYATDADGKVLATVPPEKLAEFTAEWAPLAETKITVKVEPLSLDILTHAPAMTPIDIMALEPFLENK